MAFSAWREGWSAALPSFVRMSPERNALVALRCHWFVRLVALMRFNPLAPTLLGATCWLLASDICALAQTDYRADARTVVNATETVLTNRLYRAPGTLAPTNTAIWFVADTARDGVPTNPPANAILGPDDRLIH